jgi:hypothetical protein
MNETWLYHYDSETKQQSMDRRQSDSPPKKKIKLRVQKIRWKSFRLGFFWDQDGISLDYLPKGRTVNAEYYSSLLVHLKDILKKKSPGAGMPPGGLVLVGQCPGSQDTCNPEETGLLGLPVS